MDLSTKISNLRRQLVNEYNISEEIQEIFIALQYEEVCFSAKLIAEQAARIAELERGLGDILLLLIHPEHDFIKNENDMVGLIAKSIREKLKT